MTEILYAVFTNTTQLKDLTIAQLAAMIRKDWAAIDKHAEPYLLGMECLSDIKDSYKEETGQHIIVYFLCNAVGWKGSLAHCIKAELQKRIDQNVEQNHRDRFTYGTPGNL